MCEHFEEILSHDRNIRKLRHVTSCCTSLYLNASHKRHKGCAHVTARRAQVSGTQRRVGSIKPYWVHLGTRSLKEKNRPPHSSPDPARFDLIFVSTIR